MEEALRLNAARPRAVSVHGLGFGDCGKGLVVDALVRALGRASMREGAALVVRFNGGAQAAHAVVAPDGREHVFSQFGAGTLAGAATLLAAPVVVDPGGLRREADALVAAGAGPDAATLLARVRVDGRCRVTTPFHVASGRLRERARGAAAHGSCGLGFGETVAHAIDHPDEAIRWADLARPAVARAKLDAIRARLAVAWRDGAPTPDDAAAPGRGGLPSPGMPDLAGERAWLLDDRRARAVADAWLADATALARAVADGSPEAIAAALAAAPTLVFEGAQGALLDERHGFHPHTTWSATGVDAVRGVLDASGVAPRERLHLGVLRTHLTRHGAGPLPSEDAALDAALAGERHNATNAWQGRFRRGHLDAVLLRHALATAGPFDALAVTHLDAFTRGAPLGWCEAHQAPDGARVERYPAADGDDLARSAALGRALAEARPVLDARPPRDADAFAARVETLSGLPVALRSFGPRATDVRLALDLRP